MGSPKDHYNKDNVNQLLMISTSSRSSLPSLPDQQQIIVLKNLSPEQNMNEYQITWVRHVNSFYTCAVFCYQGRRERDTLRLSFSYSVGCSLYCAQALKLCFPSQIQLIFQS